MSFREAGLKFEIGAISVYRWVQRYGDLETPARNAHLARDLNNKSAYRHASSVATDVL